MISGRGQSRVWVRSPDSVTGATANALGGRWRGATLQALRVLQLTDCWCGVSVPTAQIRRNCNTAASSAGVPNVSAWSKLAEPYLVSPTRISDQRGVVCGFGFCIRFLPSSCGFQRFRFALSDFWALLEGILP